MNEDTKQTDPGEEPEEYGRDDQGEAVQSEEENEELGRVPDVCHCRVLPVAVLDVTNDASIGSIISWRRNNLICLDH